MIRAKNEESKVALSLESMYDAFDEIVFVDNGSTDTTVDIVQKLKEKIDKKDIIKIYSYPFPIARCGDEHSVTDENSVRSLAYYYNWCLSKATFNYVVKWDADMYLLPDAKRPFRSFLLDLQDKEEGRVVMPIQTVYIDLKGDVYESEGEINQEYRAAPNRPYVRYHKGELWEVQKTDFFLPTIRYPDIHVYEIKDTREDEFSHWTTTSFTTHRKKKEWENYNKVRDGRVDSDFKKIEMNIE